MLPPGMDNSGQGWAPPQWPLGPPGVPAVDGGFLANPLNEEPMLDDSGLVNGGGGGYNPPQHYQPTFSAASGSILSGWLIATVAMYSTLLSLVLAFTNA
jgi:hypothetical protein